MAHYWIDEKKKYGFYLIGFFPKGKMSRFMIQNEKPFEIDSIEGEITPKCIQAFPVNVWASEWSFMEGHRISEINKDESLKDWINEIWKDWCKKYKRKYEKIIK